PTQEDGLRLPTMSDTTVPTEYHADNDRVPVGLTGGHRDRYLNLEPEQRRIYRYHYDVCGRLASHCYRLAIGETL
ncbi:hypothetical protein, partial [Mycobacterium avium]